MITKVLALFLTLLPFSLPTSSFAQYVQYGGVTTSQAPRQALVEKKVLNPQNNQFVDNLSFEQHTFLPGQDVVFRVTITNVIQTELKNLVVFDRLPDTLNFVSTSFGNYDPKNRTINFTIDSLKPGESKTFEIKTKVRPTSELTSNVTCQANLARVTVNNMVDEDSASMCVSKEVLSTTSQFPTTGPNDTLPILLLSSLFSAISFFSHRIRVLEKR